MSDDMLSDAVILRKTSPTGKIKTKTQQIKGHISTAVPVHRMSIIIIIIVVVSIEFILKASLEIIGHSLGRTI